MMRTTQPSAALERYVYTQIMYKAGTQDDVVGPLGVKSEVLQRRQCGLFQGRFGRSGDVRVPQETGQKRDHAGCETVIDRAMTYPPPAP